MGSGYKRCFFAYNASAYRIVSNDHETNHAFMGTNVGINLYDWQLRHSGQWKWQDHNEIPKRLLPIHQTIHMPKKHFLSLIVSLL